MLATAHAKRLPQGLVQVGISSIGLATVRHTGPVYENFGAHEKLPTCAPIESSQSHNAQEFETVTVYYRWHPLAGQKLIVHGRVNRNGERVLCRLPDGTVGSLPAWMLRADSSQFTLGKPLVSVDALRELRDLLSTLQASAGYARLR